MRLSRLALGLALLSVPALYVSDVEAAKKEAAATEEKELPKIEMTGISEFDGVFAKAKTMQDTLDVSYGQVKEGRTRFNTTLGIAADAPIKTALADLNTKAGNKISVALKGTKPSLKATDAVPENVQAGIDAANSLFDQAEKAGKTAAELGPEAAGLVAECAAFPGKIPELVKDPVAAAKALKTVNANIKAIKGTPERITRITGEVEAMWAEVKALFPAE